MGIEKLLEKEELQRERDMELELDRDLSKEKRKQECIDKAIHERELENQYNLRAKGENEELNKIKEQARQQVNIRRNELKDKLARYRKRAMQRMQAKKEEISSVRIEIADHLANAYKSGDIEICRKALKTDQEWASYCTSKFTTSFDDKQNCENEDERCEFCCDGEFGEVNIDKKQKCIEELCNKKIHPVKSNGRWVWTALSEEKANQMRQRERIGV